MSNPLSAKRVIATLIVVTLFSGVCASAADLRSVNALFDSVLSTHVKDGYVDYPEIARNVRFHKYLEALADVNLDELNEPPAQIAFWLNVYNALVIKNVIEGIRPLGALDRIKFFRTTDHTIGGRSFDLKSIDEILTEFEDPRVRFAMVNPAYAAPDLASTVYTAAELEQQLDRAARKFINDNRKNRYSDALRSARLNQIFEWHADEFGDDDKAVMAYIAEYIEDPVIKEGLAAGRYKINYTKFEWSINGRPL